MANYVLVLAHGKWWDDNNLLRIQKAIDFCQQVIQKMSDVTLVFAASDQTHSGITSLGRILAEQAEIHLQPWSNQEKDKIRMIVNDNNPDVTSTIEEIRWSYEYIARIDDKPLIFVITNRRHAIRVRFINRWLTRIPSLEVVYSEDEPPTWIHEVLAWVKLFFYQMSPSLAKNIKKKLSGFSFSS
jgi:hypothetical protein